MKEGFRVQVPMEQYFRNYDKETRWLSYWHQISAVLKTNPEKVLEIGIGNKTVTDYLKRRGIEVVTVDIDEELGPDHVCSVTELSNYFEKKSFDTILCAEVLEHLPFKSFEGSLTEISKITKHYAVITLPHAGANFKIRVKIPYFNELNLYLKIPLFWKEHEFDGQHYWEIGKKGYSVGRIKRRISNHFEIETTYCPIGNPYHRFFILKPKSLMRI